MTPLPNKKGQSLAIPPHVILRKGHTNRKGRSPKDSRKFTGILKHPSYVEGKRHRHISGLAARRGMIPALQDHGVESVPISGMIPEPEGNESLEAKGFRAVASKGELTRCRFVQGHCRPGFYWR